jgi:uncharacterized protein (TIGR00725 family)
MGSGTRSHEDLAEPLGRAIAENGWHLLTGGGRGTMTATSRAFARTPDRAGLCIGVLPGAEDGGGSPNGYPNPWVEIVIRTHLPLSGAAGTGPDSRNHINVLSANAVVALPGSAGTRSEIELALRYDQPLALLDRPPGDSEQSRAAAAAGALVYTDLDALIGWLRRTVTIPPR